ncbi:MAG: cytochrome c peroxidase [Gammaproteobacteria bacterium]
MNRINTVVLALITTTWVNISWAEQPLGLPPVPIPANNPQTPEKIALGQALFNDKRLSGDGTVSCSSCHSPAKGFTDNQATSEGINKSRGTRNAPTVLNAAYYTHQFWDGRRPSLEAQAKDPLTNSIEHGLKDHAQAVDIIRKDGSYPTQFKSVFGVEPDKITIDHASMAIASFERTLITGDSPFDRYQYGGDKTAMSAEAVRGLEVFRGKAKCSACHTIGATSAIFTNNSFHNLGVGFSKVEPHMFEIVNAFRASVASGKPVDELVLKEGDVSQLGRVLVTITPTALDSKAIGRFKTPTLRNVDLTGPYMHDGSLATLEDVINLYNQGNVKNPRLDPLFKPLNLTDMEKADLVAFMKALTSPRMPSLQASNN